jgi:uncharacterized protein YqgQ
LIIDPKSVLNNPKILLTKIMDGKINNVEQIRFEFFIGGKKMEEKKITNYRHTRNLLLAVGVIVIGIGAVFMIVGVYYNIINFIDAAKFFSSIGLATTSLGIAFHSILLSLESKKRIKDLEKQEIKRKLLMFQQENETNIILIKELIEKKENFIPTEVLNAQLKRKGKEKFIPTLAEQKKIAKGGLWIPKDEFSYDYALQVIEISHLLNENLIDKIKDYVRRGKKLNTRKDFCQQWIIARGNANPDEIHNYYQSLDEAENICKEMNNFLISELERLNISE